MTDHRLAEIIQELRPELEATDRAIGDGTAGRSTTRSPQEAAAVKEAHCKVVTVLKLCEKSK